MVITAVTNHAAINNAGEPSDRDISAETMNMPDPIIEPITIAVAEKSPIPCTNCGAGGASTCSFSKLFTFRLFYRKSERKSLTILFGGLSLCP
jgi:hypothetical protein